MASISSRDEEADDPNEPMLIASNLERGTGRPSSLEMAHPPGHDHVRTPFILEYEKAGSSIRQDFSTIDWFYSRFSEKRQYKLLIAANKQQGCLGLMRNAYQAMQGWIVLFLVGLATAATGSLIHLLAQWVGDLKSGFCLDHGFWVNRDLCCLGEEGTSCNAWYKWSRMVTSSDGVLAVIWNGLFYILVGTAAATCSSWLCYIYARKAAGSGIPVVKTILGGFIIRKVFGIRVLLIKSLGLVLAVGSGLSLGKEGPLVHIACCWGSVLSRCFSKFALNEVKKREVLSAAVAAGASAAFGAPIGGVVFSLENVSTYFPPKTMWRSFWCSITAALVLQYLDPFNTGKLVQFQVTYHHKWHYFELLAFAALGALGGLIGVLFIKCCLKIYKYRYNSAWMHRHPVLEVALIAVVTSITNFSNVYARGSSTELLASLFTDCQDFVSGHRMSETDPVESGLCDSRNASLNIFLLIVTAVTKFLLTIWTYGSMVPSGLLVPSLCMGACLGRVVGWIMMLIQSHSGDAIFPSCAGASQCIFPGIYAMVGSAAVLAGVTRMTLSLTVIMFELTGGLEYMVPIMVTVLCSKWVADAFGSAGIYEHLITFYGYPHINHSMELEDTAPGGAAEIMAVNPICLTAYGQTLGSLQEVLQVHPFHGFPIVSDQREKLLVGFISRSSLEAEVEKVLGTNPDARPDPITRCHFSQEPAPFNSGEFLDMSKGVDLFPVRVLPSTPVDRILDLFKYLGLRYCLVCSNRGNLIGIIKKKDLLLFIHH